MTRPPEENRDRAKLAWEDVTKGLESAAKSEEAAAKAAHFKFDQAAPLASVDELANYDAIVIGAPTRFGRMPSQMAAFLDGARKREIFLHVLGRLKGAFDLLPMNEYARRLNERRDLSLRVAR